ncbi:MAG TPA: polysaccharide deacetylase family protein [Candidatus Wunengus sp. YC60]|uniref:polysaccharide deacetylase family protein n=1 Tax=Candidatus Wunengus sp. YC60 TaxID=3367697 RepID=UPI00402810BB
MNLFWKNVYIIGGFLAFFAGVAILVFAPVSSRSQSKLTDERVETNQNKIPADVLSWAKDQNRVLGVQYPSSRALHILPKSIHVPILMFHYVEYVKDKGDTIRQSLDTTPYTFEQEIITLQKAGYTFMTNKELGDALDGTRSMPAKPIVLTFDDGYRDFYTDVYPILKKHNVKATEYLIAGFTGYPNNMTEDQIKEIAKDSLVEFGVHTVHHMGLKGLPLKSLAYEVFESKKQIEDMTGKQTYSFAYPYGSFDIAAINAVHQAGFTTAVSTVPGIDQLQTQRYFMYRLRPGGRTGDSLLGWLDTVKDDAISAAGTPSNLATTKK